MKIGIFVVFRLRVVAVDVVVIVVQSDSSPFNRRVKVSEIAVAFGGSPFLWICFVPSILNPLKQRLFV